MKKNILIRMLLVLLLTVLGYFAVSYLNVDHWLYDSYLESSVPSSEKSDGIRLHDYRLEKGPLELKDAGDQVSGITWSPITDSLYVVGQGDTLFVLEYSKEGELIRKIPGDRSMDVEGIAWVGGNYFAIVDERKMAVSIVEIRSDTQKISFDNVPGFSYEVDAGGNKGFEGIAWNPETKAIYVVKERSPLSVFRIEGLSPTGHTATIRLVRESAMTDSLAFYSRDLSGMQFDPKTGHFLVISDESRVLTELDKHGDVVSILGLKSGLNKLEQTIDQAEGVAMDADDTIFIVSEPNNLYIYKRALQ